MSANEWRRKADAQREKRDELTRKLYKAHGNERSRILRLIDGVNELIELYEYRAKMAVRR